MGSGRTDSGGVRRSEQTRRALETAVSLGAHSPEVTASLADLKASSPSEQTLFFSRPPQDIDPVCPALLPARIPGRKFFFRKRLRVSRGHAVRRDGRRPMIELGRSRAVAQGFVGLCERAFR